MKSILVLYVILRCMDMPNVYFKLMTPQSHFLCVYGEEGFFFKDLRCLSFVGL